MSVTEEQPIVSFFYSNKISFYLNNKFLDSSIVDNNFSPIDFTIDFNYPPIAINEENINETFFIFTKHIANLAKAVFDKLGKIFVYDIPSHFIPLISLQILTKHGDILIVWKHLKKNKFHKLTPFKLEIVSSFIYLF